MIYDVVWHRTRREENKKRKGKLTLALTYISEPKVYNKLQNNITCTSIFNNDPYKLLLLDQKHMWFIAILGHLATRPLEKELYFGRIFSIFVLLKMRLKVLLREGFNKKNIKSFGIFHPNFNPPPPSMKKNTFFSHNFFFVFTMFIITKFGENFEEKIDICFL